MLELGEQRHEDRVEQPELGLRGPQRLVDPVEGRGTAGLLDRPADRPDAVGADVERGAREGVRELLDTGGGKVVVDEDRRTSLDGVWAGGDATGLGADLTVVAVEDGKVAARAMHGYLAGLDLKRA